MLWAHRGLWVRDQRKLGSLHTPTEINDKDLSSGMYCHTAYWFSNLSLIFFELFFVLIGDLLDSKKISTNRRFRFRSSLVAELVEKTKIRSINGSFRNPFMNKIYQFLLKTFAGQLKWSNFLKNIKNQLRCYGNHHSCYGRRRTFGPVTTKIYESFLSKNVYRTEIDKVEPKLWGLTCISLILGHPVLSFGRWGWKPTSTYILCACKVFGWIYILFIR